MIAAPNLGPCTTWASRCQFNQVAKIITVVAIVAWPLLATLIAVGTQDPPPAPAPQNPSPMVEHTRAHQRLEERQLQGLRLSLEGVLSKPLQIFIPASRPRSAPFRLLIHFHGAAFVAEHAVSSLKGDYILAAVHLGPGSGVYERAFSEPAVLDDLVGAIGRRVTSQLPGAEFGGILLSGFSAGHGAIRAILREPRHAARVDGVLLLDGLHTGYVPPRTVLAEGGALDESQLAPFVSFARSAVKGTKAMVVTHSEIFPGTFASTTETTDYLIGALRLKRVRVLEWGPLGMQQLSRVAQGRLSILGFAGNSAPDHVDHYHAMGHFLALLERASIGGR